MQAVRTVKFIGRQRESKRLKRLLQKRTASLVVVRGRRRIGKSRLIEEFAHDHTFLRFSGLPPTETTTAQSQRDEFASQLQEYGFPKVRLDDWGDLFRLLNDRLSSGRMIVLLDEITWMGSKDDTFLGKLKNVWDMHWKKNPELIVVICGSVSAWIEKNIIKSTGYFGRISLRLRLDELPLTACNQLIEEVGFKRSNLEKLLLLSVTGGVPWYLEQISGDCSAEENIKRLCFESDGLLVEEFEHIFHDLFGRRGDKYKEIARLLVKKPCTRNDISQQLNYSKGGALSNYLEELVLSGFISRDHAWDFKTGKASRVSVYRLRDNYLRFYLRYIQPNLNKIEADHFNSISLSDFPGWETLCGLQFENLVLCNRALIYQAIGINPDEVVTDAPYLQKATSRQKGCQIDYLIQTKLHTLFVCEIKFTRRLLGMQVVKEVQEKIARLKVPRSFACVPILIHVGDVADAVYDADYFVKIIDFADMLTLPGDA